MAMAESVDEDISFIESSSGILRTTIDNIGTKKDNLGVWNDIYGLQRRTNEKAGKISKELIKMMRLSTRTSDERCQLEIKRRVKILLTELENYKNLEEEILKKLEDDQRNRQQQIEEFKRSLLDITQIIRDLEWGGFGEIIRHKKTNRKPWYKRWWNTPLKGIKFIGKFCWTGLKYCWTGLKYCWKGLKYCWTGLKTFGNYCWTGLKSFCKNCGKEMKYFSKYFST